MPINPCEYPLLHSLPSSRIDRWRIVERICNDWQIPWQAADDGMNDELNCAERRLGLKLPAAFREWYLKNGSGLSRWMTIDRWLRPDQLEVDVTGEFLIFRVDELDPLDRTEVSALRIAELGQEDPAVVHLDVVLEEIEHDGDAFSVHAIQQCIFEAKLHAEILTINDIADLTVPALFAMGASLRTCATPASLGVCFHAIWNRTTIYEAPDLFVIVARTDRQKYQEEGSLYICGRTSTALDKIPIRLQRELKYGHGEPNCRDKLSVSRTAITQESLAEEAAVMAEWTAESLCRGGFRADFTLDSLAEIDRFFDECVQDGKFAHSSPLSELPVPRVPALGAYLGETIIRKVDGRWCTDELPGDAAIQVQLASEVMFWPVQRIRKRLLNGPEDGIEAYGRAIAEQ